jgi:hypothetical protein
MGGNSDVEECPLSTQTGQPDSTAAPELNLYREE